MNYYKKFNLDVRIARIFNTYGPNMEKDDGRVISNFICQALTNAPLTICGDGKQTRSFCYVDDMVEGLYQLAKRNVKGEIINLGNPSEMTIISAAQLIQKLVDSRSQIIFKTIDEDDPKRRKPDITKAESLLGWQPKINFEEGLKKTIEYFRKLV